MHGGSDIFGSFWGFSLHFFDLKQKYACRRCVVEDHGNGKNDLGISTHNSPESGGVRLKWKSFMSMHQKDFDPVGKFGVLGVFHKGLFSACFSNERHKKVFEEGDSSNHLEKIL